LKKLVTKTLETKWKRQMTTPTPTTTETTKKKTSTKTLAHARDQRARPRARKPLHPRPSRGASPAVVVDPNPAAVDPIPAAGVVDPSPAAAVVDPSPAALRNAVEDPDRGAHPRRKSHQKSGRAQKVALARSPNVDQLDMLQKAVLAAALHLRARAKAKPRANSRYVTVDITRESRRKFYTPPATRDRQFSSQNTSGVDPGTQSLLNLLLHVDS